MRPPLYLEVRGVITGPKLPWAFTSESQAPHPLAINDSSVDCEFSQVRERSHGPPRRGSVEKSRTLRLYVDILDTLGYALAPLTAACHRAPLRAPTQPAADVTGWGLQSRQRCLPPQPLLAWEAGRRPRAFNSTVTWRRPTEL